MRKISNNIGYRPPSRVPRSRERRTDSDLVAVDEDVLGGDADPPEPGDELAPGFLGVPLDEIACRAGVGPGTVHRHSTAKEDLYLQSRSTS